MKRLGVVLAMVAGMILAQGSPAGAGNEWCSQDPVIQLLGSQFHVTTSVAAPASSVEGIAYQITVPSNATDAVAQFSQGNRLPSTVQFQYSGAAYDGSGTFSVRVTVLVSAATAADVQVDVSGRSVSDASFSGSTSKKVSFTLDVAAK